MFRNLTACVAFLGIAWAAGVPAEDETRKPDDVIGMWTYTETDENGNDWAMVTPMVLPPLIAAPSVPSCAVAVLIIDPKVVPADLRAW
jgi:hypothetical protein